jgi:hypothetical protein
MTFLAEGSNPVFFKKNNKKVKNCRSLEAIEAGASTELIGKIRNKNV